MKYKKLIGFWNQEQNKEIEGKILAIKKEVKVKDYKYTQYTLETKDSIVNVLGSEVLNKKLESVDAGVGVFVKIVFLGMKEGQAQEYKDFEVYRGSSD